MLCLSSCLGITCGKLYLVCCRRQSTRSSRRSDGVSCHHPQACYRRFCQANALNSLCGMLQAHLSGGQWVELLAPEHPGIAEVKWCRNRFRPFLCIAPQVPTLYCMLSS